MDKQSNKLMKEQNNIWMSEWKSEWVSEWVSVEWMSEWVSEWVRERVRVYKWMSEWQDFLRSEKKWKVPTIKKIVDNNSDITYSSKHNSKYQPSVPIDNNPGCWSVSWNLL